ncbi:MAG: hypothetical protein QM775_21205 [Pirellulales bacterium]
MKRPANLTIAGKILRAEHAYQWRIDEDDRARVARLNEQLPVCQPLAVRQYLEAANGMASRK